MTRDPTTTEPRPGPVPGPDAGPPVPDAAAALLAVRDLEAGYGPFRALFGVSFDVAPGSVTALLGANGAGKSTVARVVTGLVGPTAGGVWFDGRWTAWPGSDRRGLFASLSRAPRTRVFELARAGIVHAPEGRSVFASLTVAENLELTFRRARGRDGVAEALDQAYALFPKLGGRRRQIAGTLSGGEQRMLSLARVMVDPPKLLVADELSLGLAPIVVDEVYEHLARIRGAGTAILLVEQYVGHALALADQVLVLQHGRLSYAGPPIGADEIGEYLL